MLNHYPLNLPDNPINPQWQFDYGCDYYQVYTNYTDILSNELIQTLDNLELKIKCVVVFYYSAEQRVSWLKQRLIHSDIWYDGNQWKHYYCAINWELNHSRTHIFWWDVQDAEKIWPDREDLDNKTTRLLSGIHYIERHRKGIDPKYTITDRTEIMNKPTLIRTDQAHSTTFQSLSTAPRVAISVRFEESWNNWNTAVDRFQQLIYSN